VREPLNQTRALARVAMLTPHASHGHGALPVNARQALLSSSQFSSEPHSSPSTFLSISSVTCCQPLMRTTADPPTALGRALCCAWVRVQVCWADRLARGSSSPRRRSSSSLDGSNLEGATPRESVRRRRWCRWICRWRRCLGWSCRLNCLGCGRFHSRLRSLRGLGLRC